jgi:hypothetical protein
MTHAPKLKPNWNPRPSVPATDPATCVSSPRPNYNKDSLVTVLNLIWLFAAVAGVAALLLSDRSRRSLGWAKTQRLLSVLLVMVSLFPCVSASDDLINFAYVSAGLETRSGFGHSVPDQTNSNTVIYLALQNLEHLQVTAFYSLFVALCFFGFVSYFRSRSLARQLPSFVGRAPPPNPIS